jgi:TonB dependent receptor
LRGEVFGTATWAPSQQLSVEGGLRLEGSRISAENEIGSVEKTLSYLKPRLNVSWSPAKGHQWGLEIERVVGQLGLDGFASGISFDTGTQTLGSLDIEPEKSWAVNARYERQFGGQNSFVLAFEHVTIENFLASVVGPAPNFPESRKNTDEATRDALSIDTSAELDKYGMPGGIFVFGADLRTSHVTDPVTGEDRELSNNTDWSWNVSLQQTLAGGNFRWAVYMEDDADFQQWSPRSYFWGHDGIFLGANLSWKPTSNWTIGGGANNIIAEDSTNYSLFYDAPRPIGNLVYRQDQTYEARRQFFVNARLNF